MRRDETGRRVASSVVRVACISSLTLTTVSHRTSNATANLTDLHLTIYKNYMFPTKFPVKSAMIRIYGIWWH